MFFSRNKSLFLAVVLPVVMAGITLFFYNDAANLLIHNGMRWQAATAVLNAFLIMLTLVVCIALLTIKKRILQFLVLFILLSQVFVYVLYHPLPTAFLIGEHGDLSLRYQFNQRSMKKYYANAIRMQTNILESAAQHGDADAAYQLGLLYLDVKNPEINNNEAARWLTYAMNHGVIFAKNELANLYLTGRGVEKNAAMALKLYQEGAAAGDDTAIYNLGLLYETGSGIKQNYALAAKYYREAVERTADNPDTGCAENDLGALYAEGKGVKQSDIEAHSLFALAARKSFITLLPPALLNVTISKNLDFPAVYADYRLAVIKHQPTETTDATKLAKLVATYFQSRCRD